MNSLAGSCLGGVHASRQRTSCCVSIYVLACNDCACLSRLDCACLFRLNLCFWTQLCECGVVVESVLGMRVARHFLSMLSKALIEKARGT